MTSITSIVRFTLDELDPDKTKKEPNFQTLKLVEMTLKVVCRIPDPNDPNFLKFAKLYEQERPTWEIIYSILKVIAHYVFSIL